MKTDWGKLDSQPSKAKKVQGYDTQRSQKALEVILGKSGLQTV